MRVKGSTNNVRISLKQLVERLNGFPNIKVNVAKSWISATEEALGVQLTDAATDGEGEDSRDEETVANSGSRPKFEA